MLNRFGLPFGTSDWAFWQIGSVTSFILKRNFSMQLGCKASEDPSFPDLSGLQKNQLAVSTNLAGIPSGYPTAFWCCFALRKPGQLDSLSTRASMMSRDVIRLPKQAIHWRWPPVYQQNENAMSPKRLFATRNLKAMCHTRLWRNLTSKLVADTATTTKFRWSLFSYWLLDYYSLVALGITLSSERWRTLNRLREAASPSFKCTHESQMISPNTKPLARRSQNATVSV